jgi:predicted nucleic acid-binding protein
LYLVDTNIISVRAPGRIASWMHAHSAELFLSVVTIAEIESGIAKSAREGATRKAADLRDWLAALLHLYAERVLVFDIATAEHAGGLSDFARAKGQAPGFADIVIAATARRHGLTILSRNLRHFAPLGVPVIDPFEALP